MYKVMFYPNCAPFQFTECDRNWSCHSNALMVVLVILVPIISKPWLPKYLYKLANNNFMVSGKLVHSYSPTNTEILKVENNSTWQLGQCSASIALFCDVMFWGHLLVFSIETFWSHLVRLEEGGVLTDCSIQTQEPDETLDFDFSSAEVLNKIIMKVRRKTSFHIS